MKDRDLFGAILGRQIRLTRQHKDLTLEEAAELADIDDKNLGMIERGQKIPSAYTLYKLALRLNFSSHLLFQEVTKNIDESSQHRS